MSYPRLSEKEAEVLRLLISNGEMYGLELVRESGRLARGTVYVTLSRMEEKGFVTSRLESVLPGDGPPRRRYTPTGLGIRAYRAMEAGAETFRRLEGAWLPT